MNENDRNTLEAIIDFEKMSGMPGCICATTIGNLSHLRKLERQGLLKSVARKRLHLDFGLSENPDSCRSSFPVLKDWISKKGTEYLAFEITDKGRQAIED